MSDKDAQLQAEYLNLQDQYEDFDRRALQIKGWVAAGSLAAFGFGLDRENEVFGIWVLIASLAACFWYLEAKWKLFQYAIADRIRVLEAHFRSDPDVLVKDPDPFQIYNWWFRSYANDEPIYPYEKENGLRPRAKTRRLLDAALQSFVHLPYSLIIFLCFVLQVARILQAAT